MTWRLATIATILTIVCAGPAIAAPARPTPTPKPTPSPIGTYAPPVVPTPAGFPGSASPTPLSLHDAKMIAIARSPALELARAATDSAGAQLEITTAGALPNFSASANGSRSRGAPRASATAAPSSNGPFTSASASINLKQLIFDGGATYARISGAQYTRDAAHLSELREVDTVLFNVAQFYYAAVQARYTYQVALQSLQLAQVQEQLVEAQYRAGVASRADVLTAQYPVAQARLAVVQAANGEQTQIASLLNTMGLPSDTAVALTEQPVATAPALPAYATVIAIATAQRSDLQAANASLTAADRGVRAARAGRFPAITGNASLGTTTTGVDSMGNFVSNGGNWGSQYSFGVGVTLPLYDSGLTNGQIASALASDRTARANLATTALGVSLSVRQAYLNALTAIALIDSAKYEQDQAQTVLDVTNAQYKAGVTTLPLLLQAQTNLTKARGDYVNALFGAYTAEQNLYFAMGTISSR